jgi:hypothetical protein
MRIVNVSYSQWKSLLASNDLGAQYLENPDSYDLFAIEYHISWETKVLKNGGSDQTDFETNYKATANQPLGSRPSDTDSNATTYTTTGTGATLSTTLSFDQYALQVQVTGTSTLTTWNVVLEGSLDNVNFSTILISTHVIGQGVVWGSSLIAPTLHIRSRVIALVLGSATNIIVTILGQT